MQTEDDSSDDGGEPMATEKPSGGNDNLRQRMAKARLERGVTQAQLAERLHVKQAMISMIEAGEADYSQELAGRIRGWIDSGAGAPKKSPRGPYHKTRSTIQGR